MAPARPAHALLGTLLLAGSFHDASSLQPAHDAAEADETLALEKGPWRNVGHLISKKLYRETFEDDDGLPPGSGCYMRLPSGCQKKSIRTEAWRRDTWASHHGVDEAGCHERRHFWEKVCGDAEMLYVSRTRSPHEPWRRKAASSLQVGKGTSFEQVGDDTNSSSSGPSSNKPSLEPSGLLQLDGASAWPWVKRHKEAQGHKDTSHERAASAQALQTPAGADSDVLADKPSQPGCFMRMPSGCPRKPMKTHLWRHDPWAEQQGIDKASCEARKRVWDEYCEADDAEMVFVPRQ